MADESLDTKVAVLASQMDGLREQQKSHATATGLMFDRVFAKLDDLAATMNRGKGAFTASMILAGGIGAFLMKAVGWFVGSR